MPPTLLARLPELRDDFEAVADPVRAVEMAAYMKGHFEFLGLPAAVRRSAQKPVLNASARASNSELLAFADACWDEDEREFQYTAADVLRKRAGALEPADLARVRALIVTKSWWDTVDSLAVHVVGALVKAHPDLGDEMDAWIGDDDLWVARTAMLHQLMWKDHTDADRLFAYARRKAGHPDFFMRKAIGWALRQYARTDPDAVRAFVEDLGDTLSPLSRREALKHL
ncbi:MAG: DNA alkylation repair protein [Acidimicrobiales bacterium]